MGEAQSNPSLSEVELCTSHDSESQSHAQHLKKPETSAKPPGIETRWDYYAQPLGTQLGWSHEIEPEGLLLRTLDPIPQGRWLRLRFKLPGTGIPVITTAQVLHSAPCQRRGIARFEAKVRFRTKIQGIHPKPERYLRKDLFPAAVSENWEVLRESCAALLAPILDCRELHVRVGLPLKGASGDL